MGITNHYKHPFLQLKHYQAANMMHPTLWMVTIFALLLQAVFIKAHTPHDVVIAVASNPSGEVVFAVVRGWLLKSIDGGRSWAYSAKGFDCVDRKCGEDSETLLITSPSYDSDSTVYFGTRKYGLVCCIE